MRPTVILGPNMSEWFFRTPVDDDWLWGELQRSLAGYVYYNKVAEQTFLDGALEHDRIGIAVRLIGLMRTKNHQFKIAPKHIHKVHAELWHLCEFQHVDFMEKMLTEPHADGFDLIRCHEHVFGPPIDWWQIAPKMSPALFGSWCRLFDDCEGVRPDVRMVVIYATNSLFKRLVDQAWLQDGDFAIGATYETRISRTQSFYFGRRETVPPYYHRRVAQLARHKKHRNAWRMAALIVAYTDGYFVYAGRFLQQVRFWQIVTSLPLDVQIVLAKCFGDSHFARGQIVPDHSFRWAINVAR